MDTSWVFIQDSIRSPALVAQGIEHGSPKAGVAGSNPAEGTLIIVGHTHRLSPRAHYYRVRNTQFRIRNTQCGPLPHT